jgi:hypothetical protein
MPTQIDTPIGVGADNYWGLYGPGATDKLQAVRTNDGDTSLIYGVSGGRLTKQTYTFPVLANVVDPVTSAGVGAYAKKYTNGGGAQSLYTVWNNARMPTNLYFMINYSAYTLIGENTSGAGLALAAVNGSHGIEVSAAGGPSNPVEVWITQLYRQVTFDFSVATGAGDFAYLIGSLIGALKIGRAHV